MQYIIEIISDVIQAHIEVIPDIMQFFILVSAYITYTRPRAHIHIYI